MALWFFDAWVPHGPLAPLEPWILWTLGLLGLPLHMYYQMRRIIKLIGFQCVSTPLCIAIVTSRRRRRGWLAVVQSF